MCSKSNRQENRHKKKAAHSAMSTHRHSMKALVNKLREKGTIGSVRNGKEGNGQKYERAQHD